MGYVKAENVLPEEVIKLIQKYIDGQYLYIPRKEGNEKSWGETSGVKRELQNRNVEIFNSYAKGISVEELGNTYYLSEKSIRRIISKEKNKRLQEKSC